MTVSTVNTRPTPGGKVTFTCPVCGKRSGDIAKQPDAGWWVACWVCAAAGLTGGAYLRALAAKAQTTPQQVLGDPLGALGRYVAAGPHRARPAALPLTAKQVETAWTKLWAYDDPRRWLNERGLSDDTITRYRLGALADGVLIPNLRRLRVVGGVVRRYPDGRNGPKYRQLGPVSHWWPDDPTESAAVVCVSMFDAMLARQHGISAFCANGLGAPTRLLKQMASAATLVHVIPHVGEELAGEQMAAKLRAFGTDAFSVPLGLPERGDDLADWFTGYGRSAGVLWRRCRRARGA